MFDNLFRRQIQHLFEAVIVSKRGFVFCDFPELPVEPLVCINDLSAVALQRTLIKRGLRIPEDISITGFDNHPVCNHLVTPLTSVSQNFYEIGKLSIQLLFDIKEGKEIQPFYCLPTQVVERESVALLPR